MRMAKVKTVEFKEKKGRNETLVKFKPKGKKTVNVYTNKYTSAPHNIFNLGPNAFMQWIKKQKDFVLVYVCENEESVSYSLVTKDWNHNYLMSKI